MSGQASTGSATATATNGAELQALVTALQNVVTSLNNLTTTVNTALSEITDPAGTN